MLDFDHAWYGGTPFAIFPAHQSLIVALGNSNHGLSGFFITVLFLVQTPAPVINTIVSPSQNSATVTWEISASTQNSSYITHIIIYLNNQELKTIPRGSQATIEYLIPYTWYTVGIQTQDGSAQKSKIVNRYFRTDEAGKSKIRQMIMNAKNN